MIRAGLTPLSDKQRTCAHWMQNYFKIYGDSDPGRDEVHLIILSRREVYQHYCRDMASQEAALEYPRDPVSESRFYQLWHALFPLCVDRPWCDIPGKCKLCAEIDRLRRCEVFKVNQKSLKEVHHLHRCGMFMLERAK
jgi:hypothetical protein